MRDVAIHRVAIQFPASRRERPSPRRLRGWAEAVLARLGSDGEVLLRIVEAGEGAELNRLWRGREGPTNVLSFPLPAPRGVPIEVLGDIVVCAPVVDREAVEQGKPRDAHWAHMVVHGLLHLFGHDHQRPAETARMEQLEIELLGQLGYRDPYQDSTRP